LPIGANMVWHHLICQLIFTALRMLTSVGDFDPHRWQRCSFHARDYLQLVTEISQYAAGCTCNNLPPSVTSAPSLSTFRKRLSQSRTFSHRLFALNVYMHMHILFCKPLIHVYFLFKRLCDPPYRVCIVPLQLNLAFVTLICSLTN